MSSLSRKSLQNRVDPAGEICFARERGMFMGNRGLLHNDARTLNRQWRLKAWITCRLDFKNRKREVMAPGKYTELFFLDEATALAAGHRPCGECRREQYTRFKRLFLDVNSDTRFPDTSIKTLDEAIHLERIDSKGKKVTFKSKINELPDGTIVQRDSRPHFFLKHGNSLYKWEWHGYTNKSMIKSGEMVTVLTPKSYVKVLSAGYKPVIHESINHIIF